MVLTGSKHIIRRLSGLVAAVLAVVTLAACGNDSPPPPAGGEGEADRAGMLSIGFRVAAPSPRISRANAADSEGNYEQGPGLESYIDFQSLRYRIYFFDENDTYITDWNSPGDMHVLAGNDYWIYTFTGIAPDELKAHSNFKVMVLANWPDYPDFHAGVDLTGITVTEFVNAAWARFKAFDSFVLSIADRRLIPFYGLSELKTGVVYVENKTYNLGTVDLLRAVAKVEVNFDGGSRNFTLTGDPLIIGINPEGFCAPEGEYGKGTSWATDYIADLHLPFADNKNHSDALNRSFQMLKVDNNKWIAYLPEFRNIGSGVDYSRIAMHVRIDDSHVKDFELNFATYDADGNTTNADGVDGPRFDLRRNDLYRFHVKADLHQIWFKLSVEPWAVGGRTEIEM